VTSHFSSLSCRPSFTPEYSTVTKEKQAKLRYRNRRHQQPTTQEDHSNAFRWLGDVCVMCKYVGPENPTSRPRRPPRAPAPATRNNPSRPLMPKARPGRTARAPSDILNRSTTPLPTIYRSMPATFMRVSHRSLVLWYGNSSNPPTRRSCAGADRPFANLAFGNQKDLRKPPHIF
jgi:hypothetical protein